MDGVVDMNQVLALDGNAAAGLLQEIFAEEMTTSPAECVTCGAVGELGSLRAYRTSMGVVLRCPYCGAIVLRVAVTPRAIYLDARGAVYLRLERKG
ncbi:MAG TPA: DUF6510 family protein [Anaerolineaceae bacterium]|jgi:predicted RNA-binding Zn-ribbon protein involved in translation (DUF1610 family)